MPSQRLVLGCDHDRVEAWKRAHDAGRGGQVADAPRAAHDQYDAGVGADAELGPYLLAGEDRGRLEADRRLDQVDSGDVVTDRQVLVEVWMQPAGVRIEVRDQRRAVDRQLATT